jgi:heterodisulfide reductase subunit D
MPEPKYASLDEYLDDIIHGFVEDCTLCGECVRVCPAYTLSQAKDKTPDELLEKMMNFLKDGIFSEEVYIKAFACAGDAYCSDICPAGIDPMLVNEAIKNRLVKQGKMPHEMISFFSPEQRFNVNRVFSALQTKPQEERWLDGVPTQPKKSENVVFLGCALPGLSHVTFSLLDILEKMGVESTVLAGGYGLCCITSPHQLVESLKAFSPKRVILACPGCLHQFTEFYPKFLDLGFEVKYYAKYLADNMDRIEFTKPLEKTVIFHNSCAARRSKIDEPVRKVLENIPGLKVVKEENRCCGGLANITAPDVAQKMRYDLVEDIKGTKADYVVSVCSGCEHALYPEVREGSFSQRNLLSLVNEAMGGKEYEDKLEKCWKCGSVEELMDKTRGNFKESGYTEEEMRQVLPLYFRLPA